MSRVVVSGVGLEPMTQKYHDRARSSRRSVVKAVGIGLATGGLYATSAAGQPDTLIQQLDAVRAATRRYRNVATARADGYTLPMVVPNVGHILADPARIGDDVVDITAPDALIYAPIGAAGGPEDAELALAAAEYVVPGDRSADPPDLFADEHTSRRLEVTEEEGWHHNEAVGVTGLHAWVHRGNPAGVFNTTNPTVDA